LKSDIDLVEIVRRSVNIREANSQEYPSHFFEVELRKPRRIANDKLLNEKEIEYYLSQTCPCPFAPSFSYGTCIDNLLAPYGRAGSSYPIFLNGSEAPVFRPYRNTVMLSETRSSALGELRTIEIEGLEGGVAAVGWFIHHDYQGAIPASEGVRGLRARVGNIQVGNDRLFSEIFTEDRFCSWTIGEVHVLDPRVVPNGRRDDFEASGHLDNVIAHLRPFAAEVARECRTSSQRRNRIKSFDLGALKVAEKLDVIQQGAVSSKYSKVVKREIGSLLSEIRKAAEFDLLRDEDKDKLKRRYAEIEDFRRPTCKEVERKRSC
jgi:hypothetical protein